MTSTLQLQETIKGLSYVKLIRNTDDTVLHLPSPSQVVLDLGQEEQITETRSEVGEMVTATSYVTARRPSFNLTFGVHQPEIWELNLGVRFAVKADEIMVVKEVTVPSSGVIPAVSVNSLGYEATADNTGTLASIKGSFGISQKLTRVAYAGSPTGSQYGQGAALALKFGPDLIGKDVTLAVPVSLTSCLSLSSVALGTYKLVALGVMVNNEIVIVRANNCTPSLAGTSIDFSNPQVPVRLLLHQVPGQCYPYSIQRTGRFVSC